MGKRGPAPVPTALRLLRGTDGHHLNDLEPVAVPGTPECPDWLDPDAKAKWAELVPLLTGMGVLMRIDGDALALYCQTWARWIRAEKFVQCAGDVLTIKNNSGTVVRLAMLPQVRIANALTALLNRMQREFGMTPSSRTGIHVMPAEHGAESISRFLKIGG